jgi:hypothetical protein
MVVMLVMVLAGLDKLITDCPLAGYNWSSPAKLINLNKTKHVRPSH